MDTFFAVVKLSGSAFETILEPSPRVQQLDNSSKSYKTLNPSHTVVLDLSVMLDLL